MQIFNKKIAPVAVPIRLRDIFSVILKYFSKRNPKESLEQNLADASGMKYALCFGSGSASLYQVLKTLSEKSAKNEVILPVYTCPTVFLTIKRAGLIPVFADIDVITLTISPGSVRKKISEQTLAIVAADMFGKTSNYPSLKTLARENHIFLIADMAQSLALLSGLKIEKEDQPDFVFFSFGRAKMISTLGGGAVLTNDEGSYKQMQGSQQRNKGNNDLKDIPVFLKMIAFSLAVKPRLYWITRKILESRFENEPFRLAEYEHHVNHPPDFGRLKSCLGLRMIRLLPDINRHRKQIASVYFDVFKENRSFTLPDPDTHLFLRFPVVIENPTLFHEAVNLLEKKSIVPSTAIFPLGSTISGTPGLSDPDFPVASKVASHILLLPVHPYVDPETAGKIGNLISGLAKPGS
jgi:perosamine synthetase